MNAPGTLSISLRRFAFILSGSVCFDVVTIFSSVTRIEALRLFLSMLASASSVLHRTGSPFRKGRYDLYIYTQCTIHMVKKGVPLHRKS